MRIPALLLGVLILQRPVFMTAPAMGDDTVTLISASDGSVRLKLAPP